jgi:WD40 repeat protein
MLVLQADNSVIRLQFLPDGRRLLAWVLTGQEVVSFDIWTLPDGGRVRLPLQRLNVYTWRNSGLEGNAVAVHPTGEWCYLAWGGQLSSFRTADGSPRPVPEGVTAHQVILAPGGDRLLAADLERKQLTALTLDASGGTVVWRRPLPGGFWQLAGFLPGGERFLTISEHAVRVRTFAADDEQASVRYPGGHAYQPQLSPDGRHLVVIGYGSMYLFGTDPPGKARRITSGRTFGNFVSFALHPDGRTLAVIHGGPTLLKVYDLGTLRLARKYRWNLGPLGAVAYSPDGTLGAAGSRDGRILLWDVDP